MLSAFYLWYIYALFSITGYILALLASKYPYRLEGHKYTINKMPQTLTVYSSPPSWYQ